MVEVVFKDPSEYKPGDVIISSQEVQQRLQEISQELAEHYKGKHLLVVGLLKGAAWITSDIFSLLYKEGVTDAELAFMTVKSYTDGTTSQKEPKVVEDIDINPQGRHILIIDDICDTGKSLQVVQELIKTRDPASISTLVLLDKPSRRKVDFIPQYVGFTIPNVWVQGRGMDTDEWGRGNPDIICGPWKQ